jgi:hypothetical protein
MFIVTIEVDYSTVNIVRIPSFMCGFRAAPGIATDEVLLLLSH